MQIYGLGETFYGENLNFSLVMEVFYKNEHYVVQNRYLCQ